MASQVLVLEEAGVPR